MLLWPLVGDCGWASRSGLGLAVLLAGSVLACGAPGQSSFSTTGDAERPATTPAIELDEQLREAIAIRRTYGLRTDVEWVRGAATDPRAAAGVAEFGIPLMPDELDDLMGRRWWDPDTFDAVREYGALFPREFAGQYPNLQGEGLIVRFTDRLPRHQRALANLLPPDAMFEVRDADWSLEALELFRKTIVDDAAWFESIGVGVAHAPDVERNTIRLDVTGDQEAVPAIRARYPVAWLDVVWAGPHPWNGPRGDLRIRLQGANGEPITATECRLKPIDPNVEWWDAMPYGSDERGICRIDNIPAVDYSVSLHRWVDNDHFDPNSLLTFKVRVHEGETEKLVTIP